MQLLWRVVIGTIASQMQRHVNQVATRCRVSRERNVILVEPVVAVVHEERGDAFSLGIESFHRERLTRLESQCLVVGPFQQGSNAVVGNVVGNVANVVGSTGMQNVGCLQLLALHFRDEVYIAVHIAHVVHGGAQVVARKLGLHGIEDHWFLADALQGAVDPFR